METATIGKTTVRAKIENISDLLNVRAGILSADKIRTIEVDDALVDSGAKLLSLPKRMIAELGLELFATRKAQTAAGEVLCNIYRAVWLTVQDRQVHRGRCRGSG